MLPTFLVIGAAKGGTTSLLHYLRQHPQVFLPPIKETNFYWKEGRTLGRRIPRNLDEYATFFSNAGDRPAIGEISPQYLNSPTAAARIRRDLPAVRLIASLRNPADRAWSDYLGQMRILRETRPFAEAIAPGERILEHGFYFPRLKRYFDLFPREQIQIVLHDDYATDAASTLREIFSFIGVDPNIAVDTAIRHNAAGVPRSPLLNTILWRSVIAAQSLIPRSMRGSGLAAKVLRRTYRAAAPFDPAARQRLLEIYRSDILATADLIGRDLAHWLQGTGNSIPRTLSAGIETRHGQGSA